MALNSWTSGDGGTLDGLTTYLNGLTHEQRLAELFTLGRAQQRALYGLAESAPPLTLDDFTSDGVVEHFGWNSLPVPSPLRRFSKVFTRGERGALFGFNEGLTRKVIGPGYFVAVPTAGNEDWESRGSIVIDYYQVPEDSAPEGWPEVRSNDVGLQRFVYRHTRDFMRRLSDHVTIGAAYKGEKSLGHFFILVRQ
jgi:hypothetical protein